MDLLTTEQLNGELWNRAKLGALLRFAVACALLAAYCSRRRADPTGTAAAGAHDEPFATPAKCRHGFRLGTPQTPSAFHGEGVACVKGGRERGADPDYAALAKSSLKPCASASVRITLSASAAGSSVNGGRSLAQTGSCR